MEGVFGELAACYLDEAELLIWLDIEWSLCRERLQARGSESRRHMGREQSEQGLGDLIEWASHYYDRNDARSRSGHQVLFDGFRGDRLQLKSAEAARECVNGLTS